jgi:hypothetical protein
MTPGHEKVLEYDKQQQEDAKLLDLACALWWDDFMWEVKAKPVQAFQGGPEGGNKGGGNKGAPLGRRDRRSGSPSQQRRQGGGGGEMQHLIGKQE